MGAEGAAEAVPSGPGADKIPEMELVKQSNQLDALSADWGRKKEFVTWEDERMTGFSEQAEIVNGRTAMFFLVVGLLTELWTGQSIPDQIFTMLRVGGFVGLDF